MKIMTFLEMLNLTISKNLTMKVLITKKTFITANDYQINSPTTKTSDISLIIQRKIKVSK